MMSIRIASAVLTGASTLLAAQCGSPTPAQPAAITIAFCGPTTNAEARALAQDADIDVTGGICNAPPANYTPLNPGTRYGDVQQYIDLITRNSRYGMKTIVHDERLWSTDDAVVNAALATWAPYLPWIHAWDLGDEPMPEQWPILVERWNRVFAVAWPRTGIKPWFSNVGDPTILQRNLDTLWQADTSLTFALYPGDQGEALARQFAPVVQDLTCGVNTYSHDSGGLAFRPDPATVTADMHRLRAAGCKSFLVFGGPRPAGTDYGNVTITTNKALARAVKAGAR